MEKEGWEEEKRERMANLSSTDEQSDAVEQASTLSLKQQQQQQQETASMKIKCQIS